MSVCVSIYALEKQQCIDISNIVIYRYIDGPRASGVYIRQTTCAYGITITYTVFYD